MWPFQGKANNLWVVSDLIVTSQKGIHPETLISRFLSSHWNSFQGLPLISTSGYDVCPPMCVTQHPQFEPWSFRGSVIMSSSLNHLILLCSSKNTHNNNYKKTYNVHNNAKTNAAFPQEDAVCHVVSQQSQNHIQDSGHKVDLREEPVYGALQFPLQLINNHNAQTPNPQRCLCEKWWR